MILDSSAHPPSILVIRPKICFLDVSDDFKQKKKKLVLAVFLKLLAITELSKIIYFGDLKISDQIIEFRWS